MLKKWGLTRKSGRTNSKRWKGLTRKMRSTDLEKWKWLTRKNRKVWFWNWEGLNRVGRTDLKIEKDWLEKWEGLTLDMEGMCRNKEFTFTPHRYRTSNYVVNTTLIRSSWMTQTLKIINFRNKSKLRIFFNSSIFEKKSSSRDSSFHLIFGQQLISAKQNFTWSLSVVILFAFKSSWCLLFVRWTFITF